MSSYQTRTQRRKRANSHDQRQNTISDLEVFQNFALKNSITEIFATFGPVVTAELQALQFTEPVLPIRNDDWDL